MSLVETARSSTLHLVRTRTFQTNIPYLLRGLFFLILVSVSLLLPTSLKRWTHSFHLSRCSLNLPYQKNWDLPSLLSAEECSAVFAQEFTYLNRGAQAFVFASADGAYVLKLFFFDSPASQSVLESCRTAYLHAAQETGLVYTHLNLTTKKLPSVILKGPAWKQKVVPLDRVRFALQRRATPLHEELLRAYHAGDFSLFCHKINDAFTLLQKRCEAGIHNSDANLTSNFGFIEKEPVEIDFGKYVYNPYQNESRKEKLFAFSHLVNWMEKTMPEWKNEIESRLAPLVELP